MTNIFWSPSSALASGLCVGGWGGEGERGTLDIERLLVIMDVHGCRDTRWMKAAHGGHWERTKACHHLCSVGPVSHVRAHERRVLSLLTDRQTDVSADQAQHVEVGGGVGGGRVPVGVDGDDVVHQRFHCRAAGAAGETGGKNHDRSTKSGKLKSCLVNWCALCFNRLI